MPIKPENILKCKIAENLTEGLLKKSGLKVFPIGNRTIFNSLGQFEKTFDKENEAVKKIFSIPDLIVVNQKEEVLLVEVKFRTDPGSLEEELLLEKEILEGFWKARIVMVTPQEKPYFRVLTPPYFSKEKKEGWPIPVSNWKAIEEIPELGVNSSVLEEFNDLVEKYCLKQ